MLRQYQRRTLILSEIFKSWEILFDSNTFFSAFLRDFSLCGWTNWAVVLPPTLGVALLCSSWAGSDMWLDSECDPLHSSTWWGNNYRRAAHKLTIRALQLPVRVLLLVLVEAAYWLRAQAGSNHYFLLRLEYTTLLLPY